MRVQRLRIENFQGVDRADLVFEAALMAAAMPQIDPGTLHDALDLVLGPDRAGQYPPVEEQDFYRVSKLARIGRLPAPLRLEVTLVELSEEIRFACAEHTEVLSRRSATIREPTALGRCDAGSMPCLRLQTVAAYDPADACCDADTYFCYSRSRGQTGPTRVGKHIKRMLAPLYRSTLRNGFAPPAALPLTSRLRAWA